MCVGSRLDLSPTHQGTRAPAAWPVLDAEPKVGKQCGPVVPSEGGCGSAGHLLLAPASEEGGGLRGGSCESLPWGAGALPSPQISRTTRARRIAASSARSPRAAGRTATAASRCPTCARRSPTPLRSPRLLVSGVPAQGGAGARRGHRRRRAPPCSDWTAQLRSEQIGMCC